MLVVNLIDSEGPIICPLGMSVRDLLDWVNW